MSLARASNWCSAPVGASFPGFQRTGLTLFGRVVADQDPLAPLREAPHPHAVAREIGEDVDDVVAETPPERVDVLGLDVEKPEVAAAKR